MRCPMVLKHTVSVLFSGCMPGEENGLTFGLGNVRVSARVDAGALMAGIGGSL